MKRGMKILTAALVVLFAAGCGGDDDKRIEPPPTYAYDGWKMTVWNGSSELAGKVYLQLDSDGTFALYQSILYPGFRSFGGTYTVATQNGVQVLSGKYSDGTPLKHSYEMESKGTLNMVLRSIEEGVESEYERAVIPLYAKDDDPLTGRAAMDEEPFL